MEIKFLGWNTEGKHDKVWGIALFGRGEFDNSSAYACFWGRRSKKLQKKLVDLTEAEANKLIHSKIRKGYLGVRHEDADEVYSTFKKDIFKVALSVK